MRLAEPPQLALLLALISRAAGLDIPMEVEQPPTIVSHTPSPVIALPFHQSVTIECKAKGNPPPEYWWTKDGEEFQPPYVTTKSSEHKNGTFVLLNKHLVPFQGKYRCYASNKLGTAMTEEIELMAPSLPKFPKETPPPVFVKEGDPVVLYCNPPLGTGPRSLYWMSITLQYIQQDERVSTGIDGNLYFSHALQNDSRPDYCCFASFTKIRTIVHKPATTVLVEALPEAPPVRIPSMLLPSGVQTKKVVLKGEDLQLECIPEGYPTPKVKWMKMGEKMPPRAKYLNYGKLLTLSAAQEGDGGKYMCTATNSAGEDVHYFDVIVEEPPRWVKEPPQGQLTMIGSDVHIKCAVRGKPLPDITWRRNGEFFRDDPENNRRVLDDTVVLHSATQQDSAVYQCEASNSHGSILANVNIMVMNVAPLILTRNRQEYAVVQGDDILMDCSVFSSPPSVLSWVKSGDSEAVDEGRFLTLGDGSLRVAGAEKNDSGTYQCVANNTEGGASITAALDVKDPTRIVRRPQDAQIMSGTTAQLMCQAEYDKSLQGSFEVLWRRDGEDIQLSAEDDSRYLAADGMLQIMNVNLRDEGAYTCVAQTSLDEDNATALLTVLDVPDAPTNLAILEVSGPRNVVLVWVPGSDHNSSVTEFIVEFEESQWEPGRWRELKKVPGNQATAELLLHGHLNSKFRVYGVNAVGPGPPSEPSERHKTPPAAPDRNPANIKIQGHLPHQMDISWEPLSPIEHNGPGLEYKVSYRKAGVDDDWREHLVKRHSFVVRNTSTFTPYEIKIQSRNSHGWGPEPKTVSGYSGEDVPTAAPRDIAVEVFNTTVLRVSWTPAPSATVRGHLGGYHVRWMRKRSLLNPNKTLDERHSMSFPGNRSHAVVPGLHPFSEYRLTVNVFNKKGNGPNSDPVTFNTPEGVPGQPSALAASNGQEDSLRLVWGPPRTLNGVLTGYFLQYQHMNMSTLELVGTQEINITGPDRTEWELHDLTEGSLYRFLLSACTRAGCGPPLAMESNTPSNARAANQQSDFSTKGWVIGTMCAAALLTLVALMVCFVRRNAGGKYAVKEKEDLHPDVESQEMNDDTFCEYSDSEEKPLKGSSSASLGGCGPGDGVSRDSLVDYADGDGEFSEDGSFIGEYCEARPPAAATA